MSDYTPGTRELRIAGEQETRAKYALELLDELDGAWASEPHDDDLHAGRHDARTEIAKYAAVLYQRAGDYRKRAAELAAPAEVTTA